MEEPDLTTLYTNKLSRWTLILVILAFALFFSIIITVSIGMVNIPFNEVIEILLVVLRFIDLVGKRNSEAPLRILCLPISKPCWSHLTFRIKLHDG